MPPRGAAEPGAVIEEAPEYVSRRQIQLRNPLVAPIFVSVLLRSQLDPSFPGPPEIVLHRVVRGEPADLLTGVG
jgi:hypothetical protein